MFSASDFRYPVGWASAVAHIDDGSKRGQAYTVLVQGARNEVEAKESLDRLFQGAGVHQGWPPASSCFIQGAIYPPASRVEVVGGNPWFFGGGYTYRERREHGAIFIEVHEQG